jgi:hypothetical protein
MMIPSSTCREIHSAVVENHLAPAQKRSARRYQRRILKAELFDIASGRLDSDNASAKKLVTKISDRTLW